MPDLYDRVRGARRYWVERGEMCMHADALRARGDHVAIAEHDNARRPRPLLMAHRQHGDELGADSRGFARSDRDRWAMTHQDNETTEYSAASPKRSTRTPGAACTTQEPA